MFGLMSRTGITKVVGLLSHIIMHYDFALGRSYVGFGIIIRIEFLPGFAGSFSVSGVHSPAPRGPQVLNPFLQMGVVVLYGYMVVSLNRGPQEGTSNSWEIPNQNP